jgi:hypothetical protein
MNPMQIMKKYENIKYELAMRTRYTFSIKTGSGTNTGTDANVYFKLFGSAGTWEQTPLKVDSKTTKNTSMKFPPNSLAEINLVGPVIGDLKKIKIWVNYRLKFYFFATNSLFTNYF